MCVVIVDVVEVVVLIEVYVFVGEWVVFDEVCMCGVEYVVCGWLFGFVVWLLLGCGEWYVVL